MPGLGPDQGWVGMTVQLLVDAAEAGAEHVVFGRAVLAPGTPSTSGTAIRAPRSSC